MLEQMRQWLFPPEHRITAVKLPPESSRAIDSLVEAIVELEGKPQPSPSASDTFFAELCSEIARLEKRIPDAAATEADRTRLGRRLEAMRELLAQEGVTYRDHTGQSYDTRLNVEVLAIVPCQPEGSLGGADGEAAGTAASPAAGEVIVETVRPTVLRNGKVIVPGSVVVGRPIASEGASVET